MTVVATTKDVTVGFRANHKAALQKSGGMPALIGVLRR